MGSQAKNLHLSKSIDALPLNWQDVNRDEERHKQERHTLIAESAVRMLSSTVNTPVSQNIADTKGMSLNLKLQEINREQVIHNQERHKLTAGSIELVMFVQVHSRFEELKYLVESLNKVKDIGRCLVVFSHDIHWEKVNSVITSLATFPYMQIYFPYSVQLYPKSFPGSDPNDCPRDIYKRSSRMKKCNNFEYPDKFNHYREAQITQTKHHFLWEMNFVFETLRILKDYKGLFLRLEEDYYVATDLLHVTKLMNSLREDRFPRHNMMIMGTHYEETRFPDESKLSVIHSRSWCMGSGRGMALDRQFWQDMRNCAKDFCEYDDYGWDWSLWNLARNCMKQPVNVLEIVGSRVYHLGICKGMNHRAPCQNSDIRREIDAFWETHGFLTFPPELKVEQTLSECERVNFYPHGGWGDPRDVALCYSLMDGDENVLQKLINNSSSLLVQRQ